MPGPGHLLVSELFVSLQGEGVSAGMPAAFLRLARCNLACGFCDTPYTWDFEQFDVEREVRSVSFRELSAWLNEACPGRLIITGGEPLIQHKALAEWLCPAELGAKKPFVEVETNGTIVPGPGFAAQVDQWNVSLKLANSGEPPEKRIKPGAIAWFAQQPHAFFKFVVQCSADVEEALALLGPHGIARDRVLLMPEARTAAQLTERAGEVASWALARGVRFSSRLHLMLYGGRRGA